jgi:hypothetical protein
MVLDQLGELADEAAGELEVYAEVDVDACRRLVPVKSADVLLLAPDRVIVRLYTGD